MPFPILFDSPEMVAINKPSGILVHRTRISEDKTAVLQQLRDQLETYLFPVHRLDRGTSGVLLFAKTEVMAGYLARQFREGRIRKCYEAIIRGYVEKEGEIDYPLTNDAGQNPQAALTIYRRLAQTETQTPVGRYATARYSWIEAQPQNGRFHQIRRHFSHIRHPIIGDKKHGDVKHNRYFREVRGIDRLLLHAKSIEFRPSVKDSLYQIEAPYEARFAAALKQLGFVQ